MQTVHVKNTQIRTLKINNEDYICITDIARQKNPGEPKDVVKNWLRLKNTIEYLGLWEKLYNPDFKGVEFDHFRKETRIAIQQMKVLENVEDRTLLTDK